MTYRSTLTLALLSTMACGHVRIDDPAQVAPAAALGHASAALVMLPADTPEDDLVAQVAEVETALVDLVLAHDAWAPAERIVPRQHPLRVANDDAAALSWDGALLTGGVAGARTTAELDLRLTGERTIHVGPNVIHQNACQLTHEDVGSGNVTCPPLVDQWLAATRELEDGLLSLSATYRLTLDGDACAAGGGIDVTYRIAVDGEPARDGFVTANFRGCGDVRVVGRE